MPKSKSLLTRLWRWAADQIVQDAPEGSELCAFDCKKAQCTHQEWEVCQRRLNKAAGELMPADEDSSKEHTKPSSLDVEFAAAQQIPEKVGDSQ
jgi:hypothetical protein